MRISELAIDERYKAIVEELGLGDMLDELLSNIMKYGKGGTLRVYAQKKPSGEITKLRVVAADRGNGLPFEPNVFVRQSIESEKDKRGFSVITLSPKSSRVTIEFNGDRWDRVSSDKKADNWFERKADSEVTKGTKFTIEFSLAKQDSVRRKIKRFVTTLEEILMPLAEKYKDKDGAVWKLTKKGVFARSGLENAREMLGKAGVGKGTKFLDLGSGLGDVVLLAASLGAKAKGIEYDDELLKDSQTAFTQLREEMPQFNDTNVKLEKGDFFSREVDFSKYDVLYWYYNQRGLDGDFTNEEKLQIKFRETKFKPGTKLIVYGGPKWYGFNVQIERRTAASDFPYNIYIADQNGSFVWKGLQFGDDIDSEKPLGLIWIWKYIIPKLQDMGVSNRAIAALGGLEELFFSGILVSGIASLLKSFFSIEPIAGLIIGSLVSFVVFTLGHPGRLYYLIDGVLEHFPPVPNDRLRLHTFGLNARLMYLIILQSLPFYYALPLVVLMHSVYNAVYAPLRKLPLGMITEDDPEPWLVSDGSKLEGIDEPTDEELRVLEDVMDREGADDDSTEVAEDTKMKKAPNPTMPEVMPESVIERLKELFEDYQDHVAALDNDIIVQAIWAELRKGKFVEVFGIKMRLGPDNVLETKEKTFEKVRSSSEKVSPKPLGLTEKVQRKIGEKRAELENVKQLSREELDTIENELRSYYRGLIGDLLDRYGLNIDIIKRLNESRISVTEFIEGMRSRFGIGKSKKPRSIILYDIGAGMLLSLLFGGVVLAVILPIVTYKFIWPRVAPRIKQIINVRINRWRNRRKIYFGKEANMAIPDLHGDEKLFSRYISSAKKLGVKKLVFLGDVLDRRQGGVRLYEKIRRLVEEDKAVALLGNHEIVFLKAMLGDIGSFEKLMHANHGGIETLREAGIEVDDFYKMSVSDVYMLYPQMRENEKLKELARWLLNNAKLYHLDEHKTLHIHAGLPVDTSFGERNGLEALDLIQENLRSSDEFLQMSALAELNEHYSVVWTRDWVRPTPGHNFEKAKELYRSWGIERIVHGHTIVEVPMNVEDFAFNVEAPQIDGTAYSLVSQREGTDIWFENEKGTEDQIYIEAQSVETVEDRLDYLIRRSFPGMYDTTEEEPSDEAEIAPSGITTIQAGGLEARDDTEREPQKTEEEPHVLALPKDELDERFRVFSKDVVDYKGRDTSKALILFADDLLNNAILFDFEDTIKQLAGTGRLLQNGKVILYTKDNSMRDKVDALGELIMRVTDNVDVITVTPQDIYNGPIPGNKNEAEEIDDLLRELERTDRDGDRMKDIDRKNVLAIVRGNRLDWPVLFRDYNQRIPLIVINDNIKGIFSFAEAMSLALQTIRDNTDGAKPSNWIKTLDSIEGTEELYKKYIRYREEVLTSL